MQFTMMFCLDDEAPEADLDTALRWAARAATPLAPVEP